MTKRRVLTPQAGSSGDLHWEGIDDKAKITVL